MCTPYSKHKRYGNASSSLLVKKSECLVRLKYGLRWAPGYLQNLNVPNTKNKPLIISLRLQRIFTKSQHTFSIVHTG